MYFRERHLALTGVLLALLLALSGCGGGSTESTSASTGGETAAAGKSEAGGGEETGAGEAEEGEGGNDSFLGGGAASAAAEKEKFVEDVNNICFRHSQEQAEQVKAYEKKHGIPLFEPNQKQQEEIIVKIILPIVHETIAEFEEFQPIPSEAAKLNAFVRALTEATEATEKHPNFLAEEGAKEPYNEARARAGDMGTYLCGQA